MTTPYRVKPRFVKGLSGNPTGKNPYRDVQKLARSHSLEAMEKLVDVMRQKKYPKLALKAAELILDRAFGKAPQAVVGESGSGPVKISVSWESADIATVNLEPNEPPLLEAEEVPDGDQD